MCAWRYAIIDAYTRSWHVRRSIDGGTARPLLRALQKPVEECLAARTGAVTVGEARTKAAVSQPTRNYMCVCTLLHKRLTSTLAW